MDLSKRSLIATIAFLTLISITGAIGLFANIDTAAIGTEPFSSLKLTSIFTLIFSLGGLITISIASFLIYRDMSMEPKILIVLIALFIILLFDMISSSIDIAMVNNPLSTTISSLHAPIILSGINAFISIPAFVASGYILQEL